MSLRRSPRFIFLLVLVTLLGPLAMQMFLPALPAIQREFATDASTAQLTLTVSMIAMGVSTLVFGPLSDRFGRKPVLLLCLAMFSVGSLASALAPSVALLILARIVQSGGASAGIVLARAMTRDVYGFKESIRVISYLTMVMIIAPAVSPAIGGVVIDNFGWRTIFWSLMALAGAALVGVALWLPETHGPGAQAGWRDLAEGSRRLLTNRRYLGYTLILTCTFAVFFAFLAAAPYLTAEVLHKPARDYGFWFMPVAGIFLVSTFIATRLLDRYGADRMIRAGVFVQAVVLAASLPFYYWLPLDAPLLFVPMIVISFVQGFIIPNSQASAINVDPRYAGAGSGLAGFIPMVFSAAVAQAVAVFADGTVWPMLGLMALATACGIACLGLIRAPKAA